MKFLYRNPKAEFIFGWSQQLMLLLCLLLPHSSMGKGGIGENQLPPLRTFTSKPLIGYLPISKDAFDFAISAKIAGLPASLLIEGAKSDPEFRKFIQKTGKDPQKIALGDWYKASKSVADLKKIDLPAGSEPITYKKGSAHIHASFSVKAVDTELFSNIEPSSYLAKHHDTEIEYVKLNYDAAKMLHTSYSLLESTNRVAPLEAQKYFRLVNASMTEFPLLASAVQQKFGEISFGNPLVFSSKEKKLVAPASVTGKNDVYLIQFAITLNNMEANEIKEFTELTFGVQAPIGIMALDLIPFKIEKEVTENYLVSSPAIKVETKGVSVELGEFFKQEKIFTSLRPRLFAGGLQQNSFFWTLLDDAIQQGSHRFIAILQAPKGKEQVTVELQVTAKIRKKWYAQGNILSAETGPIEIQLTKKR